jgi:hypothetical protein
MPEVMSRSHPVPIGFRKKWTRSSANIQSSVKNTFGGADYIKRMKKIRSWAGVGSKNVSTLTRLILLAFLSMMFDMGFQRKVELFDVGGRNLFS